MKELPARATPGACGKIGATGLASWCEGVPALEVGLGTWGAGPALFAVLGAGIEWRWGEE